jgi:hypothetical protein
MEGQGPQDPIASTVYGTLWFAADAVKKFLQRVNNREVAGSDDPTVIALVKEERQSPEFEFLKRYISDRQLRIQAQMGLALRKLESDPQGRASFEGLRANLRAVFGLPGLHVAELVSNGVVTTYLNLLVSTEPTSADVSSRLERFLRQADSFVLFVVSKTPIEQTLEKVRARLMAHGSGTVAVFAKGLSRDVLARVLKKLERDPERYIIDVTSSADSTIALVSTPEAWYGTDALEPPKALVRRKTKR